jgi:hypothetical protein
MRLPADLFSGEPQIHHKGTKDTKKDKKKEELFFFVLGLLFVSFVPLW